MTSSRGIPRPHPTSTAMAREGAATVLTLAAAAGLMGLATSGTFDDATDPGTRSVLAPPAGGR